MSSLPMQFEPMLNDEDRARAEYYALLARLYFDGPDAGLLAAIAAATPVDAEAGAAFASSWAALQLACRQADPEAVGFEYSRVFISTGKALVTPYALHYASDSMKERRLVQLREELAGLGLARLGGAGIYEDHIAALCEIMRHLVMRGSTVAAAQQQKQLFINYIEPSFRRFSIALDACDETLFYRHVGRFSKAFFEIEAEALSMV